MTLFLSAQKHRLSTIKERIRPYSTRIQEWFAHSDMLQKIQVGIIAAAVVSAIATYVVLVNPPFDSGTGTIFMLINIDIVLLLAIAAIVGRKIVKLWLQNKRGVAGSNLHSRMTLLFSSFAVIPAIIMAVFSVIFLNFGVNTWFSDTVSTAVEESQAVAKAYLVEHQQVIRADVLAMANDLNRQSGTLLNSKATLNKAVAVHASLRNFPEVMIFNDRGQVLAQSGLTFLMATESIPRRAYEVADRGDVVLLRSQDGTRVRALAKLDNFVNAYLFVSRYVDPEVISHIEKTSAAAGSFQTLRQERSDLQIRFAIVFVTVTLLLMLLSVWGGLHIATTLTSPIRRLIAGAEKMQKGDLTTRVTAEGSYNEEMRNLIQSFNKMAEKLEGQRGELITTNEELDIKNRFTQAVLSGVSAGIIGLDEKGLIQYPNQTACELLGLNLQNHKGEPIKDLSPEFSPMLQEIQKNPKLSPMERQVQIKRQGRTKTLLVRLACELEGNVIKGFVFTFDDISELLNAQRAAAWSDVARRLAHEIKNPLTPIHLSAERLKSSFAKQISEDKREQFEKYTDIIIRQVDDLGQLLDEFSSFARMPAPQMSLADFSSVVEDAALLMRQSTDNISFKVSKPQQPVMVRFDSRQVRQCLINIVKNASESIEEYMKNHPEEERGAITLAVTETDSEVSVVVEDTGKGLPAEDPQALTEPYYTTRKNGTGLGLAVVAKIVEDHSGQITFQNRSPHGAIITLKIPKDISEIEAPPQPANDSLAQDIKEIQEDSQTLTANPTKGNPAHG